jgi:excisionase family DNA binding protein
MNTEITKQLLRVTEVCHALGMSRSSVYREIDAGRLNALKIGKSLRISREELDRFIGALQGTGEVA